MVFVTANSVAVEQTNCCTPGGNSDLTDGLPLLGERPGKSLRVLSRLEHDSAGPRASPPLSPHYRGESAPPSPQRGCGQLWGESFWCPVIPNLGVGMLRSPVETPAPPWVN